MLGRVGFKHAAYRFGGIRPLPFEEFHRRRAEGDRHAVSCPRRVEHRTLPEVFAEILSVGRVCRTPKVTGLIHGPERVQRDSPNIVVGHVSLLSRP